MDTQVNDEQASFGNPDDDEQASYGNPDDDEQACFGNPDDDELLDFRTQGIGADQCALSF